VKRVGNERFGPVDFEHFHEEELPAVLEQRLKETKPIFTDTEASSAAPIAFRIQDGPSYTYVPAGRTFGVERGEKSARTVVGLAHEDWWEFRWELKTCYALFYADRLNIERGSFGQVARWEPAMRVAFDDQAIYDIDDPQAPVASDGSPMDLGRSFSLEDPEDEIRDFLERAGFVHLRGVMKPEELEALNRDVDAGIAGADPEDRRSWWTTVDGQQVCSRVNYLNEQSELIASIGDDERFIRIGALGGPDLKDARDRMDGNGVVVKVPGAESGLADLPWHRDCGMGGHPVKCPMLNVGIQLDAASAAAGRLVMIAGSHRGSSRMPGEEEAARLPTVGLDTEPGDVTVHFGHTLHAAPPPARRTGRGRRALYVSYVPPATFEMIGPGQGYNDVLFTRSSGRIRHVSEIRAASRSR
jgi:Phytanoyl-CoA dioxygenase (PhyH)